MNKKKMSSNELKTKVLHYWRFERRFPYIATEAGRFDSDVLVSDGKSQIIEIEIKVNKSDLIKDLNKKKHKVYANPFSYYWEKLLPTRFYFAIPYYLKDTAFQITEGTNYGILGVKKTPLSFRKGHIVVAKQAKEISKFSSKLHHAVVMRMGSELIRLRLEKDEKQIRENIHGRGKKKG